MGEAGCLVEGARKLKTLAYCFVAREEPYQ